ncbi:MAG: helix-turn-helix transcriptional regulator [Firmicutes bacterium]|nr:helix-turn-helix transcriptional regulator [Bacillota bacterium]
MPESFERGALTEATYLILLSLCEARHGYGVMQHVSDATRGRVNLGAGTLYGAISLLLDKGWIEAAGGDERKKLYRVTRPGMSALEGETARLDELLAIGRETLAGTGLNNESGGRSNGPCPAAGRAGY